MSLMKPENRERFRGDERTYLDEWSMTEAKSRPCSRATTTPPSPKAANIYFLAKIFATAARVSSRPPRR